MTDPNERLLDIVRQGPRLVREAQDQTPNVNEAYLLAHRAMAQAMDRALNAPADSFDGSWGATAT